LTDIIVVRSAQRTPQLKINPEPMKRIFTLLGIGLVLWIGAVILTTENVLEITTIEKEVEVTPDWASDKEAVEAAQAVIRRKELESELETLNSEINTRKERVDEIEKELGVY
jgi:hypothetical protein